MEARNENDLDKAMKHQTESDAREKQVQKNESKLNEFKVKEALGESFPQTLLQLTIVMKEKIDSYSLKFISAVATSILSLLVTLSSLQLSLPFFIFDKKQTPFKSLSLLFTITLPILTVSMFPRLTTLVMYLAQFDKTNAWVCVVNLLVLGFFYLVGYWSILRFNVRPKMMEQQVSTNQPRNNR